MMSTLWQSPDDALLLARDDHVGRDVLTNDRSDADDRVVTNRHVLGDDGSSSDPDVGPDSDREQLAENDREYSPLTIDHSPIWLEDESQRIGDINIPHDLWKTIRQAPVYFFDIPFEKRLQRIVEEYGNMDREKLVDSITRIERRLGSLETKNAINYLHENNTVECFRILLKYYDKWYLKSLHNRNNLNSLLVSISCENVGLDNTGALRQQASIS